MMYPFLLVCMGVLFIAALGIGVWVIVDARRDINGWWWDA